MTTKSKDLYGQKDEQVIKNLPNNYKYIDSLQNFITCEGEGGVMELMPTINIFELPYIKILPPIQKKSLCVL